MMPDILKKTGCWLIKHSPALLTGLSVGGVISTTILALKAGPNAQLIVDDLHDRNLIREENGDYVYEISKSELFRELAPVYIPVIVSGVLTIVCVVMANGINMKRQAVFASLYSASETALKEYQAKMTEKLGAKEERKVRSELARDRMRAATVTEQNPIIVTGDGDHLCYDVHSDRLFYSNYNKIEAIRNRINDERLKSMDCWVPLNEFYYQLNLKRLPLGEGMGWDLDNAFEIDYDSEFQQEGEGPPCRILMYNVVPRRY